jgi:hypothetical protein
MSSYRDIPVTKTGWAGEEMEIAHQRGDSSSSRKEKYQTVNLEQFRNNEVGNGYQARGVVRQKTGEMGSKMNIIDMTKKQPQSDGSNDDKEAKKRRSKRQRISGQKDENMGSIDIFLQCQALRDFRKELEKILSEAKAR